MQPVPKFKPEVASNIVKLLDFSIQELKQSNNDLSIKAKENINRILWLFGGFLGLIVIRSDIETLPGIVLILLGVTIVLIICLLGYYFWYFLRVDEIKIPNPLKYVENNFDEQDYAELVKRYVYEIIKTFDILQEININYGTGLKWVNRLFILLIGMIVLIVLFFSMVTFFNIRLF